MRRFRWIVFGALVCVHAIASATLTKDAKAALEKAVEASNYTFTPAVRQAYINYTEAVIRDTYGPNKINAATWTWVKRHPQILSAVAAADDPVNPNILLNFQRLALGMGASRAEKWTQLALAYAIRYREDLFPIDRVKEAWDPARLERLVYDNTKGKGGDFALLTPEDYPQDAPPEEVALGEWLAGPQGLTNTRAPFTIGELMEMPLSDINAVTARYVGDDRLIQKEFPDWDRVALVGKIFPPYVDGTPTPQRAVLMKIFRNGRIPGRSDRPNFSMEKADWPILLYLADLDHIDETSFVFGYFVAEKKIPPTGLGQVKSSSGSAEAELDGPNFKYARSNWHPEKFIRVYNGSKKDQGGKSQRWMMNAVNVPATVVSAPPDGKFYYMGERGNYTYYLTCADNAFTGTGSSAPWELDAIASVDGSLSGSVRHDNFIGLAATLNQGLEVYEDARMTLAILNLLKPGKAHRISMLESVFVRNPLNQDIFYALAAAYRGNASVGSSSSSGGADVEATLRMLAVARIYAEKGLKTPVSSSYSKSMHSSLAKIMAGKQEPRQPMLTVKTGTEAWFFMMCNRVVVQFLRDTNGMGKEAFKAEFQYQQQSAAGQTDKPIVRALDDLKGLVN